MAAERMAAEIRRERFCREYAKCLNGTKAYKAAGYNPKSDEVAAAAASVLLRHPKVVERLAELQEEFFQNAEITPEQIAAQYKALAFNDATKAYDSEGNLLPVTQWPRELRAAVTAIETSFDGEGNKVKKLKLADKKASLDSLAKINRMFVDRVEVEGKMTLEQLVNASKPVDE